MEGSIRVQASIEQKTAHDRRRFARSAVHVHAQFGAPERPSTPAVVTDLSTGGCGIETQAFLNEGDRVWIKLPALESWPGRVVWTSVGRAGLEFDRPLHPAIVDRYTNG